MDGRTYSPTRIAISAILVVAAAMLLVAAALAGPTRSAAASGPAAAGKVGGTLRVNLSTTDVQYTDPSLEYESTGWQIEYATALKLLNWRETKATLFPEAATSFPLVSAGGRATRSTSGPVSGSATGRRSPRRTSGTRSSGRTTPR